MDVFTSFISGIVTVGFPSACCAFLLWQNSKRDEYYRKQQDELRKSIDNNTKAIAELCSFIKRGNK